MARSQCFIVFLLTVHFLEKSVAKPFGETQNNCTKNDIGGILGAETGTNTNIFGTKLQLPSFQIDPNFATTSNWDPTKLLDAFKGFNSSLNINSNPLTASAKLRLPSVEINPNLTGSFNWVPLKLQDIFKGFNSSINLNSNPFAATAKLQFPSLQINPNLTGSFNWDPLKLQNIFKGFNSSIKLNSNPFAATAKLQFPSLQINPNLTGSFNWDPSKLQDIFKGFGNLGSFNGTLNLNANPLGDLSNALKGLNGVKGLNIDANVSGNLMKVITCVVDFFKGLNIDLKPVQDFFKGLGELKLDPQFVANFKKGLDELGKIKIDSNIVDNIAKWINGLGMGLQIDPSKLVEILGGAGTIEGLVGTLGAIDLAALAEVVAGIVPFILLL